MWLTNLIEGTDYYISYVHPCKCDRTYRGKATFICHTHVGLDICLFNVDGAVVAFPHCAVIHELQNDK